MECPQCKSPLIEASDRCRGCGFSFSSDVVEKLRYYFILTNEMSDLKRLQGSIGETLVRLSDQIGILGQSLRDALERAAAPVREKEAVDLSKETMRPEPVAVRKEPPRPVPTASAGETGGAWRRIKFPDLELRVGQRWSLIVGIITLVFGVGYFLKYSFDRGWIGPAGRVAMAYVSAAGLLSGGEIFRRQGMITFGLNLAGGGIAILYFSTFAAYQFYSLLGYGPAFFLMILTTALAGTLSVLYGEKWLAVLGLIGGFLTPLFLSTGQDNQIALMSYMTVLNLGVLGIGFGKKWDLLNRLGFISTYLLYAGWFARFYADSKFWPAILFLQVFYLIYVIVPFAYEFLAGHRRKPEGLVILTSNSFIAFAFGYYMVRTHFSTEWAGAVSLSYAAVFLLLASIVFRQHKAETQAFLVFVGSAALFLVITVPIVLSKHWITVFWALQGLILLWTGLKLNRSSLAFWGHILAFVAALKFVLYDYPNVFMLRTDSIYFTGGYFEGWTERVVTSAVLLATLFQMGRISSRAMVRAFNSMGIYEKDHPVSYAMGGGMLFLVLNVEVAAYFHQFLLPARFAAISVLWTLFSICLLVMGFKWNQFVLRRVSLILFGLTLAKVFFLDISRFSVPYRIVSFVILGLFLIATSYLYYRFREKIESAFLTDQAKRDL